MNEVAVVVSSCDKYCDLWEPFFTLFFRYWPDCPYPVYLGSNHQIYPDARVKTIPVGEDENWSSGFRRLLEQIPHPYVILLLEDYLIDKPVDTNRFKSLFNYMKKRKAGCLRLYPRPGPEIPCQDNPDVGEIRKGADYRLSLQAALWDKQILLGLLREGETAWDLEVLGSRRSDKLEVPFLSVWSNTAAPITYFRTAVAYGKWVRDAVRLCEREGIKVDLGIRPCESETWLARLRRSFRRSRLARSQLVRSMVLLKVALKVTVRRLISCIPKQGG